MEQNLQIERFHDDIRAGNIAAVKKFLDEHSSEDKLILNGKRKSAAATSLESNQAEIYELLIEKKLRLDREEDVKIFVGPIPEAQHKIRDIHKRYAQDPNLSHLSILIKNSKLSHDTDNKHRKRCLGLIAGAFEEINEIEWVESVLKIVSQAKKVKIIFDFNRTSVSSIDPTKTEHTRGTCYHGIGDIFIASNQLLNIKHRYDTLSVLAHEMTHYAMQIIYNNNCKPYLRHDRVGEDEFTNILKITEERKFAEQFIFLVFNLEESVRQAELIVRVPHLLALYKENPGKFIEMKSTFGPLFNYFESKVLVDLNHQYPVLKAKRRIEDLNQRLGLIESLSQSWIMFEPGALKFVFKPGTLKYVWSTSPHLTLRAMHQQLSAEADYESTYIFTDLQTIKNNERKKNLVVEALGSGTQIWLVIDCSESKIEEIMKIIDSLQTNPAGNCNIIAINDDQARHGTFVNHSWSQLTKETQTKLLEYELIFQGEAMRLLDVFLNNINSDALEDIELGQLLRREMNIGGSVDLVNGFTIERSFQTPNNSEMRTEESEVIRTKDLINKAEEVKVILLFNDPGVGKSTEFKLMAQRIKRKLPTHWIVYLDMKEYVDSFQRDGRDDMKAFGTRAETAEYFCTKILKLGKFETKLFTQLFNDCRIVFLIDGFDEISPRFKKFNVKLMSAVKTLTKNQVWISSRTHLKEELEEKFGSNTYMLMPFTRDDREIFLAEVIKEKNMEAVELPKLFNKIKTFALSFDRWVGPEVEQLANPLLLRMIADLVDDIDYDFDSSGFNIFLIYKSFVNKMLRNCMKKGREAESDIVEYIRSSKNIMRVYQKFAFNVVFDEKWNDSIDSTVKKLPELTVDEIVRVGLVTKGHSGSMNFVHRTFAEYFVADYFTKNLCLAETSSDGLMSLFKECWSEHNSHTDPYYVMVTRFYDQSLELESDDRFVALKARFKNVFDLKESERFFVHSVLLLHTNVLKLTCTCIITDKELLKKLLVRNYRMLEDLNALEFSFRNSPKFLDVLLLRSKEIMGAEELKTLLLTSPDELQSTSSVLESSSLEDSSAVVAPTFLIQALSKGYHDAFEYILESEIIQNLFDGDWSRFMSQHDEVGSNLLMLSLKSKQFEKFIVFIKIKLGSHELVRQLKETGTDEENAFFNVFWESDGSDTPDETPKNFARLLNEIFTREEARKMIFHKNSSSQTAFMLNIEMVKYFDSFFDDEAERREVLLDKDKFNMTSFHYSVLWMVAERFKYTIELYKRYCSTQMEQILSTKTIGTNGDKDHPSILFLIMRDIKVPTLKVLWNYMTENFGNDWLKNILLKTNDENETIFEAFESKYNFDMKVEVFKAFIEENFDENEKSDIKFKK